MLLQNSLSKDANQATSQSLLAEPSPVEKSARQAWLGACLQVGFSYFITHADKPIADDIVTKYREGIAKLEQGVPLAYVIGRQGFWRHEFKVNQYTLIPRPDTETLVETVLNLAKNRFNLAHSLRLLDLGTGSGCIAISLAAEQPNWQVTATDFSTQALAVAQHNAQQIGTANVEFYQGSWFQALPDDMPLILLSRTHRILTLMMSIYRAHRRADYGIGLLIMVWPISKSLYRVVGQGLMHRAYWPLSMVTTKVTQCSKFFANMVSRMPRPSKTLVAMTV